MLQLLQVIGQFIYGIFFAIRWLLVALLAIGLPVYIYLAFIADGTQPQKVTDLLLEVAAHHPEVSDEPAPSAIFRDFGADALEFQLNVWIGNDRWFRVSGELRSAITLALTEAGIEISFPQRDLHIRSIDDSVSLPEKGRSEG